jgi:hypothetical protein
MALDAPEVADAVALLRAILADDRPAVRAILDIVDVSAFGLDRRRCARSDARE